MTTHHWTTRAETPADIPAVHALNCAAFPTAEEAELVDALRQDPAWIDGLSLCRRRLNTDPVASGGFNVMPQEMGDSSVSGRRSRFMS